MGEVITLPEVYVDNGDLLVPAFDKELEMALDEVGRDQAFSRAKAHGWQPGDAPPKWVWWGIIAELRSERPKQI